MEIKGIITAMITPFDDNENINEKATRMLVNRLIDKGVNGLFILGTNGEFHVISDEEKLAFAKIVIEEARHRVPVYVGTGGNRTKDVIELSKKMEALGADALSVITPYFAVPTEQELVEHYKAVAAAVQIPIILYNIPKNTGINIPASVVKELAKIKNIAAIKDSSGNMENMQDYMKAGAGEDFVVLAGSDSKILPALKLGAAGAIAGTSNVITEQIVALYAKFLAGDIEGAEAMQQDIEVLRKAAHLASAPSVFKKSLEMIGIPVGPARRPVLPPAPEVIPEIEKMLKYYSLL